MHNAQLHQPDDLATKAGLANSAPKRGRRSRSETCESKPRFYSPFKVGQIVGESAETIRTLIREGLLNATPWGSRWRIMPDEMAFYRDHGRSGLLRRAGRMVPHLGESLKSRAR